MTPSIPVPVTENYLFTYGTLMEGFDNPFAQRLRMLSERMGTGSFPGTLYRISWYPGAVYEPQNPNRVFGEVYQILQPDVLFPELDEYEDITENESESLYVRKQIPITLNTGEIIHAWTYLYNQPVDALPHIENGRFTAD